MTHNDYEDLYQIRYRWQKEQHLIRKKYQIPYNMTYTSKQCLSKPISITTQPNSVFKDKKISLTHDDLKEKTCRLDKPSFNIKNNDLTIPPMYCSKCHLYLTECSCPDGLGQWWMNLQKKTHSTDKIFKNSFINSIHEQHVGFDSSSIDFSSSERTNAYKTKSKDNQQQYVLLDWNNRQSLMNFIRTIKCTENLSTMTIEQLRELIINNDRIHIFNSMVDLILCMNKEQHQAFFCHIYIDPSYYSTIQGIIPLSQSYIIADNTNFSRTLHSIQKIAILLGVKIDQSLHEFLQEKPSRKQRKSILHQQTLSITSKIPYNTFRNISVHSQ